ncbi:hypothetical protein NIES25_34040 [Nostoc linckia NIES-25]|nr:hypothetical protein NIES25_34040 [Nostoc linckia NIES-25]
MKIVDSIVKTFSSTQLKLLCPSEGEMGRWGDKGKLLSLLKAKAMPTAGYAYAAIQILSSN